MLLMVYVYVSVAVGETPFTIAFTTVTVTAVETAGEASRLRKLVLRRRVEVVVGG
jgi:hypothetical protein